MSGCRPLDRSARRTFQTVLQVITTIVLATGGVLAHSGHVLGHEDGGNIVLPTVIVLGSVLVIGASAYLEHTGEVNSRFARVGILFGLFGTIFGLLAFA